MRCFCLWQKRCACGAMCAFGTLRIAGRVRLRSSVRFCLNARTPPPPRIQKQPRLRLFFGVPGGSRKEQSDEIAKRASLLAERSASRRVRLRSSVRFCLNARTPPPPRIQKQPRLRLFFGVPGGSRTLDTRRRRPVLYPTELRIRL